MSAGGLGPLYVNFHGIGRPPLGTPRAELPYWLSLDQAKIVLDWVARRRDVRITSDDGNLSDIEVLSPLLVAMRRTAIFFMVASRLGKPGYASVSDLRNLRSAGMEIGCHGMTHEPWARMSAERLRFELVDSAILLENALGGAAGEKMTRFACPLGRYDAPAIRFLRHEAHATRIYTSDKIRVGTKATFIPRLSLRSDMSIGDIQQVYEMHWWSRAWALARIKLKMMRT